MHAGNMINVVVNWQLFNIDHRYLWLTFRSTFVSWVSEPVACRSKSSVFGLSVEAYNMCVNGAILSVFF